MLVSESPVMFDEGDKIRTVRRLHGPLGSLLGPLGGLFRNYLARSKYSSNMMRTLVEHTLFRGGPGRSLWEGPNRTGPKREANSRAEIARDPQEKQFHEKNRFYDHMTFMQ